MRGVSRAPCAARATRSECTGPRTRNAWLKLAEFGATASQKSGTLAVARAHDGHRGGSPGAPALSVHSDVCEGERERPPRRPPQTVPPPAFRSRAQEGGQALGHRLVLPPTHTTSAEAGPTGTGPRWRGFAPWWRGQRGHCPVVRTCETRSRTFSLTSVAGRGHGDGPGAADVSRR